jgi:hypothetical protein
MDNKIKISTSKDHPNTNILDFVGNIDSDVLTESKIPQKIDWLINEEEILVFIFDFLETESIDSSTIGLAAKLAKHKKSVKIVCLENNAVYDSFEAVKLFSVLPRFDTLNNAFKSAN